VCRLTSVQSTVWSDWFPGKPYSFLFLSASFLSFILFPRSCPAEKRLGHMKFIVIQLFTWFGICRKFTPTASPIAISNNYRREDYVNISSLPSTLNERWDLQPTRVTDTTAQISPLLPFLTRRISPGSRLSVCSFPFGFFLVRASFSHFVNSPRNIFFSR
jgi:hypothetical protein